MITASHISGIPEVSARKPSNYSVRSTTTSRNCRSGRPEQLPERAFRLRSPGDVTSASHALQPTESFSQGRVLPSWLYGGTRDASRTADSILLHKRRGKEMDHPAELKNHTINFQIRHVYIPAPHELLAELHGDDILQGEVLDVTQSGEGHGWFAVVHVEGLRNFLIVPVERIVSVA